jgi:hypothetical protein
MLFYKLTYWLRIYLKILIFMVFAGRIGPSRRLGI